MGSNNLINICSELIFCISLANLVIVRHIQNTDFRISYSKVVPLTILSNIFVGFLVFIFTMSSNIPLSLERGYLIGGLFFVVAGLVLFLLFLYSMISVYGFIIILIYTAASLYPAYNVFLLILFVALALIFFPVLSISGILILQFK